MKSTLKSLVILANLIGSQWCHLFTNHTIFCSKSHHFLCQWEWDSKTKQPIWFQCSITAINKFQENERQKVIVQRILQLLMPKLCYCFSPKIVRFQNGSNKVAIELRVAQFWSEIILVISNRTCAMRSFDFEITRMIPDQIALHSVQLPLWIVLHSVEFLLLIKVRFLRQWYTAKSRF